MKTAAIWAATDDEPRDCWNCGQGISDYDDMVVVIYDCGSWETYCSPECAKKAGCDMRLIEGRTST